MGHTVYVRTAPARGVAATHAALRFHPNFDFPPIPPNPSEIALVNFIIESVARFVSPPKVKDEDQEFACDDIAAAIRTKLKPEILARIREQRQFDMARKKRS